MAIINGTNAADILIGTSAGDVINGFGGNDDLSGGGGNDRILGGNGNDTLFGEAGADILEGGNGNDRLDGGDGNDRLLGGAGVDRLLGGAGNDLLDGGTGADIMRGGLGDDKYIVDNVGDRVLEQPGEGTDLVESSVSYELLNTSFVENLTLVGNANLNATGNDLNNVLTGNSGDNVLTGKGGSDTLIGNEGNDTLIGGSGIDRLVGGAGDDIFVYELLTDGIDTIFDFDPLQDVIQIAAAGFNPLELVLGTQDATFKIGAATSATDRFLYDSVTGALSFDADGNGLGAAVQFTTLQAGLAMTGTNINVV